MSAAPVKLPVNERELRGIRLYYGAESEEWQSVIALLALARKLAAMLDQPGCDDHATISALITEARALTKPLDASPCGPSRSTGDTSSA